MTFSAEIISYTRSASCFLRAHSVAITTGITKQAMSTTSLILKVLCRAENTTSCRQQSQAVVAIGANIVSLCWVQMPSSCNYCHRQPMDCRLDVVQGDRVNNILEAIHSMREKQIQVSLHLIWT